jgi:hypothetical protein
VHYGRYSSETFIQDFLSYLHHANEQMDSQKDNVNEWNEDSDPYNGAKLKFR